MRNYSLPLTVLAPLSVAWSFALAFAAPTPQPRLVLPPAGAPVTSIAFWPDRSTLAGGYSDDGVSLWNLQTGHLKRILDLSTDDVLGPVAFSPDGKTLANAGANTSSANDVLLWYGRTGRLKRRLKGETMEVNALLFSPDGAILASGARGGLDGEIRLRNARTGRSLRVLKGYYSPPSALAFSPDGRILASASWEGPVRLWDVRTGKLKRSIKVQPDSQPARLERF